MNLQALPRTRPFLAAPTFAGDAVGGPSAKNHPFEKHVVADILLRPGSGEPPCFAALFLAETVFVEDLAATVPGLPEPAIPS